MQNVMPSSQVKELIEAASGQVYARLQEHLCVNKNHSVGMCDYVHMQLVLQAKLADICISDAENTNPQEQCDV